MQKSIDDFITSKSSSFFAKKFKKRWKIIKLEIANILQYKLYCIIFKQIISLF